MRQPHAVVGELLQHFAGKPGAQVEKVRAELALVNKQAAAVHAGAQCRRDVGGLADRQSHYSADSAPAATNARSLMLTLARSNFFAEASMRSSACAMGMTGFLSPGLTFMKRTGLMRATT